MDHNEIEELLSYDPYRAAMDAAILMGVDEKDAQQMVGRGQPYNHLVKELEAENFHKRTKALYQMGDTHLRTDISEYINIAISEGFQVVYNKPIPSSNPTHDTHVVLAHEPLNLILNIDSQYSWMASRGQPKLVSTCNLFFCADATYNEIAVDYRQGDFVRTPVDVNGNYKSFFAGSIFVKEGLKHKLQKLKNTAHLGSRWWFRPKNFYLTNHSDKRPGNTNTRRMEEAHDRITEDRLREMPEFVRQIVGKGAKANADTHVYQAQIMFPLTGRSSRGLFSLP